MYLRQALAEFEMRLATTSAPGTRKGYVADVEVFLTFAGARTPTECLVRRYLDRVRTTRGAGPARLARIGAALHRFFSFCVEEKILTENPAARLPRPRQVRRLPVFLTVDELERLFAAPDPSTWIGQRDRCILTLLAMTGLRLNELVSLDRRHVDLVTGQLRVMGKGNKERFVPINDRAREAIRAWLEVRPEPEPKQWKAKERYNKKALFLNRHLQRLGARSVEHIVRKHAQAAGIKKRFSPHKLRHTFATQLHLAGVDVVEIQKLLGHATINTTMVYTHTTPLRLKAAVKTLDAH